MQTILSIRLRILTGTSEVRQYFKAKMVQATERAFCGDHSLQTTALPRRQTSKPNCRVSICGSVPKRQLCRCFFMCILRFYVPVDLFVPLCGNNPAVVKVSGDTITIDPDATTEDSDSNQIPNPLTVHNSLAELAKAVGFDVKAPTVPAEQGISETEVAAVVSSAL